MSSKESKQKIRTNKFDLELANLIKSYRLKANMTQVELAEKLNYTSVFICYMEKGLSKIPLRRLAEIIDLLNIPEKKVIKILQKSSLYEIETELSLGRKKVAI